MFKAALGTSKKGGTMKQKTFKKQLVLNKKTIANMNETAMVVVKGGELKTQRTCISVCAPVICAESRDATCETCAGLTCVTICVP